MLRDSVHWERMRAGYHRAVANMAAARAAKYMQQEVRGRVSKGRCM